MELVFKKHYRRMQGFLALFLASVFAVCFSLQSLLRSAPGPVLLTLIGCCLVYAFWFRRGLSRDGILPTEFRSYMQVQPMMLTAQAVLFLFTIVQVFRLMLGK